MERREKRRMQSGILGIVINAVIGSTWRRMKGYVRVIWTFMLDGLQKSLKESAGPFSYESLFCNCQH